MNNHSPMYAELLEKWHMNYVTLATMKKWVKAHDKNPEKGITREEFKEITGEDYTD